jgi:hypothetical protein
MEMDPKKQSAKNKKKDGLEIHQAATEVKHG